MSRTPAELATDLVEAFGRPDEIAALLAEDAVWWISPTIPPEIMNNVSKGRETIRANMERVFSVLYTGESVRADVHSAISDGTQGAVRATITAEFPSGGAYSNEYCIFIDTRDGEISHVWEYVDAAWAVIQMQQAGIAITPAGSI
ncbi:SnoaL-like domain protein [Mycobacterium sp. THAF192]|nr:SnoaL-like domain protein [Mycobacterium sp. THAF192]